MEWWRRKERYTLQKHTDLLNRFEDEFVMNPLDTTKITH